MIYPEPEKGGRGHKNERVEEASTLFSAKRLQEATRGVCHGRRHVGHTSSPAGVPPGIVSHVSDRPPASVPSASR
jgi:hypothetical protein